MSSEVYGGRSIEVQKWTYLNRRCLRGRVAAFGVTVSGESRLTRKERLVKKAIFGAEGNMIISLYRPHNNAAQCQCVFLQ